MKNFKATKIFITSFLLIVYSLNSDAQKISNLINATVDTSTGTTLKYSTQNSLMLNNEDDTIIENRLVALALSQPNYGETIEQQKILEYQLKKQRNSWLNLLSISTTYNDQSFAKPTNNGTTAYVYPKYFFGITIPIGLIVSNGTDIKITKESELIAKGQQIELAKTIKANVLSYYKQYKANQKLLVIESQALDDEQASFLQAEQKFKDGTATLDVYNDASKKYNEEQVKIINLQLQQDLLKVELERLIGRKLEDALK